MHNGLYSTLSYTTFIPNGYYYLPYNHPSTFEKNNYIVEIIDGTIVRQWESCKDVDCGSEDI